MQETIHPNGIIVLDRDRRDYGDLDELLASIEQYGIIQPIVINHQNELIAGGRRLAAAKLGAFESVPIYRKETLSSVQLHLMELEENLRRKALDWREEVHAIVRIHREHKIAAAIDGKQWTRTMTGEVVGYSESYVSYCHDIHSLIDTAPFAVCEGIADAIKLRARQREDLANAELRRRTNLVSVAAPNIVHDDTENINPLEQLKPSTEVTLMTVSLSDKLFFGDCLKILPTWPAASVDHIICDPPYALNLAMLQQASDALIDVGRVEDTHNVEDNLQLFKNMFPVFARILKPTSFCVLFCDLMRWQTLYDLAIANGFQVQRWPLVWSKLGNCKNQCIHKNTTKDVEFAMICRRPKAIMAQNTNTSVISCLNSEHDSNPFAKPSELWNFILEAVTQRGQTILDPFAGEGSSIVPGYRLLRKMVGIECDSLHFNSMLENVKNYWKTQFTRVEFK